MEQRFFPESNEDLDIFEVKISYDKSVQTKLSLSEFYLIKMILIVQLQTKYMKMYWYIS